MSKEIQQWEYQIRFESPILTSNRKAKEERLNIMGEEGWELVSWVEATPLLAYAIFKRPKQQP